MTSSEAPKQGGWVGITFSPPLRPLRLSGLAWIPLSKAFTRGHLTGPRGWGRVPRGHRGRTSAHEREKRAARLIPARRRPQATHGTYRGDRVPDGVAVAPVGAPRGGGASSPPPRGVLLPRGVPERPPSDQRPQRHHRDPTGPRAGKKARRPTDPRETAAPGHPRCR